ncbi:MAG: glycosyltransferase family 4 protein [Promethearchaeota archaeon]
MKKIAVIRGANLNKFEMQTHEALKSFFHIEAFCIIQNDFSLEEIDLPIHKFWGVEVFFPNFLKRYKRYYDFLFNFWLDIPQPMFGIKKKLKGFDILHVEDITYYYSYQAAKAKRKYGYKLVAAHSENVPYLRGRNWLAKKRISQTIQEIDLFLPRSERAKEVLLLSGVSEEKIEIIPHAIDTDVFKPQSRDLPLCDKYGIDQDELLILYVGRIARSKGMCELIYAFKKLVQDLQLKSRRIKLMMAGSGPLLRRIKRVISELNLDRYVVIPGNLEYREIPKIHNLADIFVMPSIPTRWGQEKFGIAIIESMACAKPVISTLSGSIPEVVGEAGILVPPADFLSLYQAIKRLILDETLRMKLGQMAKTRVEKNFSVSIVAKKLKEIYRSL